MRNGTGITSDCSVTCSPIACCMPAHYAPVLTRLSTGILNLKCNLHLVASPRTIPPSQRKSKSQRPHSRHVPVGSAQCFYCTRALSRTPPDGWGLAWRVVNNFSNSAASPTVRQPAQTTQQHLCIPPADRNSRAISCRLPAVHALGKPLQRTLTCCISNIAIVHSVTILVSAVELLSCCPLCPPAASYSPKDMYQNTLYMYKEHLWYEHVGMRLSL